MHEGQTKTNEHKTLTHTTIVRACVCIALPDSQRWWGKKKKMASEDVFSWKTFA